jgi:BlaI family transcriptional regulator, penicillinase repressor
VRDEANRAHVYRAAISQDAMQSKMLKDLTARLFSGSAAQLALHALSMAPASDAELDEIRALLAKRSSARSNTHTVIHNHDAQKSAVTHITHSTQRKG